eukprot:scaffold84568_cov63-Phaeocystis_antarctica.AAC.1
MLSPPTPGIGGEAARSEAKQGGAEGHGRRPARRAARSAEVRKCGARRDHLPRMSQPCEATCINFSPRCRVAPFFLTNATIRPKQKVGN